MLIHKPLVEVAFDGRHCGLLLNHRKHFVRVASVHINLVKQVKGCAGVFILGSPFGVLLAWVVPSPHEHLNVLDHPRFLRAKLVARKGQHGEPLVFISLVEYLKLCVAHLGLASEGRHVGDDCHLASILAERL